MRLNHLANRGGEVISRNKGVSGFHRHRVEHLNSATDLAKREGWEQQDLAQE